MAYLQEFRLQAANPDVSRFLQLWEEYCNSDTVDIDELIAILRLLRDSDLSTAAGRYVEAILPVWNMIEDPEKAYEALSLVLDIQTTNSELLADTSFQVLKERHSDDENFGEKVRLVGLRHRKQFEGCINNYELLSHLNKGKYVYHTGGWGTGEVMDISLVREELNVEFENIGGRRDLSFRNAFKTLQPIASTHFLARRFADPDKLESEARAQPVDIVKMLLQDCGAKTAAEIKEEMCVLVIPEEDWTKWWQSTRAKLKKDTMVEAPRTVREPFRLRSSEVSHEERFKEQLQNIADVDQLLLVSYNFVRDLPDVLKDEEIRTTLTGRLKALLTDQELTVSQRIQVALFLEKQLGEKNNEITIKELVQGITDLKQLVDQIDILAFKKRLLAAFRKNRSDWRECFLELIFAIHQNPLRDYLFDQLHASDAAPSLQAQLKSLMRHPGQHPEATVWYFQKALGSNQDLPMSDSAGRVKLFEAFLTLYHAIELKPEFRDLLKKMYNLLTNKRYAMVRELLQETSVEEAKEMLLLASKCQTISQHDKKILRSLAEVVHTSLADGSDAIEDHILWTTEEGFSKTKTRLEHLSSVEIVENAREIEAARALGDLRENSEYKFALERRSRLQNELKMVSEQLNRARILTPQDIHQNEVGVGCIVEVEADDGSFQTYTILGPWEANPEENILSFESRLAQEMMHLKTGESFEFKSRTYTVREIRSYLGAVK